MRTATALLVVVMVASLLAGCIQPMPVQEAQQDVVAAESALCASIEAYDASVAALEQVSADTTVSFSFRGVRPGTYAIALLHDENANGKADKALIIPKEGFGFSRDAKVRMGPPKFSAAAFTVADDPVQQRITMRYLF